MSILVFLVPATFIFLTKGDLRIAMFTIYAVVIIAYEFHPARKKDVDNSLKLLGTYKFMAKHPLLLSITLGVIMFIGSVFPLLVGWGLSYLGLNIVRGLFITIVLLQEVDWVITKHKKLKIQTAIEAFAAFIDFEYPIPTGRYEKIKALWGKLKKLIKLFTESLLAFSIGGLAIYFFLFIL